MARQNSVAVQSKNIADDAAQTVCKMASEEIEKEEKMPWASVTLSAVFSVGLYRACTPETEADRTGDWFTGTSWYLPLAATVLYLGGICGLGKHYMTTRKPFKLQKSMLVYNFFQTCFNTLNIIMFFKAWRKAGMMIWGNSPDSGAGGFDIAQGVYLHYMNKYVELLDTTFMMLRKKNNQMSFLHIYHHVLLVWSWFAVMKISPTGDSYFGASANTIVHIVMYSYYFLSALGVSCFWKRYITQMQLAQFVIVAGNSFYCWYHKTMNPVLPALQLWVMATMFILFYRFYQKSYNAKKAAKTATAADAEVIKAE